MEREGFYDIDPLQENHGQIWGLVKTLDDFWQIHVKVMPDGLIECEIEPKHDYPAEHLDQQNSFSGHHHVSYYLKNYRVPCHARMAPVSCLVPAFKKPGNPVHISKLVAIIILVAGLVLLATAMIGERK